MKIVVSPAKSLDFETALPWEGYSQPQFLDAAEKINAVLRKKTPRALAGLMSISGKLAELNWERNQGFHLPFGPGNARPAIFAFSGDVYQGLDAYSLRPEQFERLQDTLRILSGLYGILRPLDLIQPYRLEMGTALKVGRKKNLYEFWKKTLTDHMNASLEDGELFLNLASQEYFGALDAKRLKVPVITPVFKDWKGDQLKTISFFAKRARGSMVRYILDTDARTLEDIKGFDREGYGYSEQHGQRPGELVFVR